MMPEERAVIEAAEAMAVELRDDRGWRENDQRLLDAVDAMQQARAQQGVPTAWGRLVEGDRIRAKDGSWYTVRANVVRDGMAHVDLEGVATPMIRPSGAEVPCLRGATGRAADMWSVMVSR